jgi:hypothetical protein
MVKQNWKRDNRELGRTRQAIHKKFQVNIQKASINRGAQTMHTEVWRDTTFLYLTLEYNQKFGRRRILRTSNRRLHIRAPSRRLCQRDGANQAKKMWQNSWI